MDKNNLKIILCAALAIVLAAVVLGLAVSAADGEAPGEDVPQAEEAIPFGYKADLFDTSYVHSLDIRMPAEDWEMFLDTCTDKAYWACDLAIDGETFADAAIRAKGNSSMNMLGRGEKYSFKIEFDHYADWTYQGLDKLNLNNMIMDDSCMKDYLVYRMMDEFGVDAPLCSFVFVTVNGEDFGLYLAVEGVEDSFLERNYGPDHGALYKPDSISNHKGDDDGGFPDFGSLPSFEPPSFGEMSVATSGEAEEDGSGESASFEPPSFEMPAPGGFGGGMGANDVKLQYIDNDPDSYPNIFDSAKTDISRKDKYRLIEALRELGERENLESTLDTEEVLRYFVSHIFTCNSDSYTGGMIHNYYLYEQNGQLSMIPWDYNLAFGQQGRSAASAVNDPIDTPTSSSLDSLPMIAWIFDDGQYFDRYHALYRAFLTQFIDSGWIDETLEAGRALLAPYVARDPHSLCTVSEFQSGVDKLELFCALRAQSIAGQLDGTIPSTTEGQRADSSNLIDTSSLASASGEPSGGPSFGPSGEASSPEP